MTARSSRCAVYTRKSSEEGLEQAFNSLDAQREAGLDYIKSQKHQGWLALDAAYDDGGFSGGSTNRPGLQRLLADIRLGKVDIVLVYKVDRLSRSLTDFVRIMQLFDEHKVSFVSITQQFNTTTSMGRLTLNMLLSFAQFEREVSGERIRDKIAATKRKGVWVCGQPPLGYRLPRPGEDRRLRIVDTEANLVRAMFTGYLESGSLIDLAATLNAAGHTTRRWISSRGRDHGGRTLTNKFVYRVLTNPVYLGKITHTRAGKTEVWPGLHTPIVDRALWDRVHARMELANRETRHSWTHTHLLKGKVRTFEGHAMSPGSVQRPSSVEGGPMRFVRYYVSQKALKHGYRTCPIKMMNAGHLDDLVRAVTLDHLLIAHRLDLGLHEASTRDHWVRELIETVVLAPDRLTVELRSDQIAACARSLRDEAPPTPGRASRSRSAARAPSTRGNRARVAARRCPFTPQVEQRPGRTLLTLRVQIRRLDGRRVLLSPDGRDLLLASNGDNQPVPRDHIVHAVGLAYAWQRELMATGSTIEAVARRAGLSPGRVHHLLRLTQLGPAALRAILTGSVAPSVTLKDILLTADRLDWSRQSEFLRLSDGADTHDGSAQRLPS